MSPDTYPHEIQRNLRGCKGFRRHVRRHTVHAHGRGQIIIGNIGGLLGLRPRHSGGRRRSWGLAHTRVLVEGLLRSYIWEGGG